MIIASCQKENTFSPYFQSRDKNSVFTRNVHYYQTFKCLLVEKKSQREVFKNAWTRGSIFCRPYSARLLLLLGHSIILVFRTRPATLDEPKSVVNDFARVAKSEMIISKASKSARVRFEKLREMKGGQFEHLL